jgi:hypothetical protein
MWTTYHYQYGCSMRMLRMAADSVQHACMVYFLLCMHVWTAAHTAASATPVAINLAHYPFLTMTHDQLSSVWRGSCAMLSVCTWAPDCRRW